MPYDDDMFEGAQADTLDEVEAAHDSKQERARKARERARIKLAQRQQAEDDETPGPSLGLRQKG